MEISANPDPAIWSSPGIRTPTSISEVLSMRKWKAILTYLAVLGLILGFQAGPTFARTSKSTTSKSSTKAKKSTKSKKSSKEAKAAMVSAKSQASSPTENARVASNRGLVWVNPDSKVFHRSGDRWYGKTKNGKYMTESEALKEGYHLAKPGGHAKSNK